MALFSLEVHTRLQCQSRNQSGVSWWSRYFTIFEYVVWVCCLTFCDEPKYALFVRELLGQEVSGNFVTNNAINPRTYIINAARRFNYIIYLTYIMQNVKCLHCLDKNINLYKKVKKFQNGGHLGMRYRPLAIGVKFACTFDGKWWRACIKT